MSRAVSTSARVRPAPFRWFKAALALALVGYASALCLDRARQRRVARAGVEERDRADRRESGEALVDLYGGRASLADLERAVAGYGKK